MMRAAVGILALTGLAFSGKLVVDAFRWRDQIAEARAVMSNRTCPEKERREAIIVLQKHMEEMISELRRIASDPDDPNGKVASNAIHWINEKGK